jgi:hypothetical protein
MVVEVGVEVEVILLPLGSRGVELNFAYDMPTKMCAVQVLVYIGHSDCAHTRTSRVLDCAIPHPNCWSCGVDQHPLAACLMRRAEIPLSHYLLTIWP